MSSTNLIVAALILTSVFCSGEEKSKLVKVSSLDGTPIKEVAVEISYGGSTPTPVTAKQTTDEKGEAAFEKQSWSFKDCYASLPPFVVRARFYDPPPQPLKIKWPRLSLEKSERFAWVKIVNASGDAAQGVKVYDYSSPQKPELITTTSEDGLVELGARFRSAKKFYLSGGTIGMDVDLAQWKDRAQLLVISMPAVE